MDSLCSSVMNSCSSLDGFDAGIFSFVKILGYAWGIGYAKLRDRFSLVDIMYNVLVLSHRMSNLLTEDSQCCRGSCITCASQAKPERNRERRKASSWQSGALAARLFPHSASDFTRSRTPTPRRLKTTQTNQAEHPLRSEHLEGIITLSVSPRR